MNKEYKIKNLEKISKATKLKIIGAIAGIAIATTAVGLSVHTCNKINNNDTNNFINYGTIKFSGEYLDEYDKECLHVLKTTKNEYFILAIDSNKNYYVLDDFTWYKKYASDHEKISMISSDGTILSGTIDKLDNYLEKDEKKKSSFSLYELMDIQNRITELEYEKTLTLAGKE